VDRLVHISTPSVVHTGEPIIGAAAEPAARAGHSAPYPATKAEAERLVLSAADERLGVVAIRPHLIWGPNDTQLVGRIVGRARRGTLAVVGGGTALIDTTYIDNAVSAVLAALDRVEPLAPCSGQAYVIANYEPRPVGELLRDICSAAGLEVRLRSVPLPVATHVGALVERAYAWRSPDREPPLTRFLAQQLGTAHWFDPRPALADLGWAPSVTIEEGLERLRAWFADGGFEQVGR
jgi:nucleoside-diphosphate-sugar epimerase